MSARSVSPKPRIEESTPSDAIITPPGTPGAAITVIVSIKMKWIIVEVSMGMPCIIINAKAQATILSILPERCIVAQSGTTKSATPRDTPLSIVCLRVTGIVAALDCVPSAVI